MFKALFSRRPVTALILILIGLLVFWFGPILVAIIVRVIGGLMVVAGIIMLVKHFLRAVKR